MIHFEQKFICELDNIIQYKSNEEISEWIKSQQWYNSKKIYLVENRYDDNGGYVGVFELP